MVAEELGLRISIGKGDPIEHVAGEAAVVLVALRVEPEGIEVEDRRHLGGTDLIDEVAHVLRRGADLLGDPALDGIENLEPDQLGQAPQAQHPAVGGLAGTPAPLIESPAPWAAGFPPQPVVHVAEPEAVSGDAVATGGSAVTKARQRSGVGEECDQVHASAPVVHAVGQA
ncbi:MAG: hypothetical protein ACR2MO_09990 [Acidimicrobiales bacterium]